MAAVKASDVLRRAPLVVERLEPNDFADRWGAKPTGGVAVGLRFVSDYDEGQSRKHAAEAAAARFAETSDKEAADQEYNDELMARIVGASLCDPNDVTGDPDSVQFPEDTARHALRSSAIARLFSRIERLRAENLGQVEASDDDVEILIGLLETDILSALPENTAKRSRRLIHALLDLLN